MLTSAKEAMHEAIRKLENIERNFMAFIYSDDDFEDAQVVREILNDTHEVKKLVRLTEYRARHEND